MKDQGIALRTEFWHKKGEVRAKYAFPLSTYRERRAEIFRPVLKVKWWLHNLHLTPKHRGQQATFNINGCMGNLKHQRHAPSVDLMCKYM